MNVRSISWKRLFIIPSTLILGACGGGGSSDPASCVSGVAGLCAALNPNPKPVIISTLFTTAPSKISLAFGETANYIISGGTAPYIATIDNTSVVSATASGTRLTISSKAEGPAKVVVTDATGKTITIDVQVFAKGQTGLPSILFVTAPTKITLASGGNADYIIGGGSAPYTATSGNTGVVTTTASGTKLSIGSIAAGSTQIAVVDATGKTVTIDVTVLGKGQTGIPPSVFPASLKTSDCTTNIPFIFTGGTAPYTILTSDNVAVPVSLAQPFGSDSYFLASIRSLFLSPDFIDIATGTKTVKIPRTATVTVLDSQSQVASATISIETAHLTCADNPLLQTEPASANAHPSEILAFQITGGQSPYSVTSTDASVVTVPAGNLPAPTFNAQAMPSNRTTQGTALLTITSADGQKANIRFTVLPQF